MFWINIRINPKPNSTADKIKKKNVRDNKFVLLNNKPVYNVIMYKVIHINSAVNNKCKEVFTFKTILINIKKKIKNKKFKSPKDIK
jgi:hypothetical protein